MTTDLAPLLKATPVVPVVTISELAHAVPLAKALLEGGLGVMEITLRTPVALEAIRLVAQELPQMIVGAGTLLDAADFARAEAANARFLVSPGSTPSLIAAAKQCPIPWLPGAATLSEMMALREAGYKMLKFFPAEAAGGAALLRSAAGPLPDLTFCPTGGISFEKAKDYAKLGNVITIGGSWLTPKEAISEQNWLQITALARQCLALRPQA